MPKLEQSRPPYVQICDHYKSLITRGDLSPGDPIPTLRKIAEEWGVSQVTASKAVNLLQDEGHVKIGGPGLRTVVVDPKTVNRNGHDRAKSVRRTGRIYTPGEYAKIQTAEIVNAPDHVADALGDSSPKLLVTERILEGSWGYVEQQTGKKATRGRDQISTRLATAEDAQMLGIELPAAVKVSTTFLWTDDGFVVEYGVSVAGAGRESTYDYTLSDDDE